MKRRIIALLLALVMALGLVMPASATGPDGTTIGGDGEPVVITGEGTDTTTPAEGGETPATPTTPTEGEETPAAPATPVDGEDEGEDEDDTPAPLGMAPLGGDTPVTAAVTTETSYLDENGETKSANAIPVTASTTAVTWGAEGTTTWYVVNESVTINNTVTVKGNVNLILADDAELTVNGKATMSNNKLAFGIYVLGNLTIYAQSATGENIGKLTVTAAEVVDDHSYGIEIAETCSLTVNGGVIEATGGKVTNTETWNSDSYGIGGLGAMTINGGKVEATGGEVTGSTNNGSHGICVGSTLNVNGGAVEATGGEASSTSSSGIYVYGTLNVNGGEVEATGGAAGSTSSGIRMCKYNSSAPAPKLNVNGGKLTATGGTGGSSFGISIYSDKTKPDVTLTSGTLIANSTGTSGNAFLVIDSFTHITVPNTCYLRTEAGGDYTEYTATDNKYSLSQGGAYVELTTRPSGDQYLNYMDWNGTKLVDAVIEANNATAVTDTATDVTWNDGTAESPKWYVVRNEVTITGEVTVTGNVHLILCNGAELTVNGGVLVGNGDHPSSSLTIYGQDAQTGKLTTSGSTNASNNAISSGVNVNKNSSLTVNGGTIIANGSTRNGSVSYGIDLSGSGMTVNSGKVTAIGQNSNVESIGINLKSEESSNPEQTLYPTLTINGGTVIAKSESNSGNAVKNNSGTLTPPTTYWWRTAAGGKYKDNTKAAYTADALAGTYFELTTTQPAESMLDKVKYLDWDEETKTLDTTLSECESPTKITSSMTTLGESGKETWYYVEGEEVRIGQKVTVTGNVHLILCDGATLTVNGGIEISSGASLTIYGQSGQSGKLTVSGQGDIDYGIRVYGSLTVNGGNIAASGEGHGIYTGGTLTINNGTLIAKSNDANGKAVSNNATLALPTAYWWRTATTGDSAKYRTQLTYDSAVLTDATYFEVTTTAQTNVVSESVSYVDQNGSEALCSNYSAVPSNVNQGFVIWGSGSSTTVWYVVNKNTTINGTVGVYGNVNLILCNGATLTVTGGIAGYSENGDIRSALNSGSLTIYGQKPETNKNTGKLEVNGFVVSSSMRMSAGIMLGALTINGGEVKATGCDATKEQSLYISAGVYVMQLAVNGGKLTAIGGKNASTMSYGIVAMDLSVNEQPLYDPRGIDETEEDSEAVAVSAPVIEATGGEVSSGASIGIYTMRVITVDSVNLLGGESYYDLSDDTPADSTGTTANTTDTHSATIIAKGGTAGENGVSYGMATRGLYVGVSRADIMSRSGSSLLDAGEEEEETPSTGSTVVIEATGDDAGILTTTALTNYGLPSVWLNGGKLTATGKTSGITIQSEESSASLATFGLDTYDDTEDGTETAPTVPTVYVQKGTLIADATGTGKGLALGDLVNSTVPLECPAEYWWRINKAVNGYKKYPSTAYSYNGTDAYVEITTEGEGLPLLPESGEDKTPLPGTGPTHQPIRRQNNAMAALVPSTDGKTDVTSPETFDAGIALYVGLGVLSLTGSAAWVGKRRKW